jgi:hypothetical protein
MHCLPGRAPPKNKNNIFLNYFWFIFDVLLNDLYFFEIFFVWGALPGSAGCLKKATETPNAGHRM